MTITLRVIGAVLILISLQDQFQTLFHPAGRGALSDWTGKIVWKTMRFFARRNVGRLTLAGPFALLLIIVIWAGLLCLGWACLIFRSWDLSPLWPVWIPLSIMAFSTRSIFLSGA
jgi:hypothetical protein